MIHLIQLLIFLCIRVFVPVKKLIVYICPCPVTLFIELYTLLIKDVFVLLYDNRVNPAIFKEFIISFRAKIN